MNYRRKKVYMQVEFSKGYDVANLVGSYAAVLSNLSVGADAQLHQSSWMYHARMSEVWGILGQSLLFILQLVHADIVFLHETWLLTKTIE